MSLTELPGLSIASGTRAPRRPYRPRPRRRRILAHPGLKLLDTRTVKLDPRYLLRVDLLQVRGRPRRYLILETLSGRTYVNGIFVSRREAQAYFAEPCAPPKLPADVRAFLQKEGAL